MSIRDWVTVVAPVGKAKDVARELLAAADSPNDVRTIGTGTEFLVAPYVADRINKSAPAPAPRRARRTKKEDE